MWSRAKTIAAISNECLRDLKSYTCLTHFDTEIALVVEARRTQSKLFPTFYVITLTMKKYLKRLFNTSHYVNQQVNEIAFIKLLAVHGFWC